MEELFEVIPCWVWPVVLCLAIWDFVWKMIGLWKSARSSHLAWFICIAVFNTVGILPIIYVLIQRSGRKEDKPQA